MLRGSHWCVARLGVGRQPRREAVLHWWGCCLPNRLGDRAGGYRRIVFGLAALPVPLGAMAGILLVDGSSTGNAMAHAVAAAGCGWLAVDLVRHGSSLNRHARPHASTVGLLIGIALLIGFSPVEPTAGFGPPVLLVTGMAGLVAGYLVLMASERYGDPFLFVVGRLVVVAGAVLVGAMQLGQTVLRFTTAPIHAIGLGGVATLLLAMAWYEGRVLLRGAALVRALARR